MKKSFLNFVKKELGDNFLLFTTGLPATWKTETSEEVVKIKNCPMLRSDIIRLEVLKGQNIFDDKVAGNMDKRLSVYDELFRQADAVLQEKSCVILDATFITQALRKQAAAVAAKNEKTLVILETCSPQDVSLAHIQRRTKEKYESNALTEQAYFSNKAKFEAVDIAEIGRDYPGLHLTRITVDTAGGESGKLYITGIEKLP